MRKIRTIFGLGKRGFTVAQVTTCISVGIITALVVIPIILRMVDNIKREAVIATLWSIFEFQAFVAWE